MGECIRGVVYDVDMIGPLGPSDHVFEAPAGDVNRVVDRDDDVDQTRSFAENPLEVVIETAVRIRHGVDAAARSQSLERLVELRLEIVGQRKSARLGRSQRSRERHKVLRLRGRPRHMSLFIPLKRHSLSFALPCTCAGTKSLSRCPRSHGPSEPNAICT